MVIEHREGFKCKEHEDKPVFSGRLDPRGEHRIFHSKADAEGRKNPCRGQVVGIQGYQAPEKPAKAPKAKKEGAKPRKPRTKAAAGAVKAQDAAYEKAGLDKDKVLAKARNS